MRIHTSFECANGKNIKQVSDNHFQIEVKGDARGYCAMFSVAIEVLPEDIKKKITLDVFPDPEMEKDTNLPADANFYGNEPGVLWWRYYKPEEKWDGKGNPWRCLDNHYFSEGFFEITPDLYHIELNLNRFPGLKEKYQILLSSFPFIEYTAMQTFLTSVVTQYPDISHLTEIGSTAEERKINGLIISSSEKKQKMPVAIISGQHPVEVSGVWATKGIIEYLLSSLKEVEKLREKFIFHIFPQMNPDGLVHGKPQQNLRGTNMSGCFEGAAEDKILSDPEAEKIWKYFRDIKPALILNFHGYYGPRNFGQPPYDGCYSIPIETVDDTSWQEEQKILNDLITYYTPAASQWPNLLSLPLDHLECQLAKFCHTIGFCYEPNIVNGPLVSKKRGVEVFKTSLNIFEGIK